ncbi:DUF6412 domain-containing protein [Cellulomonas soli]|uniref:DUF6412 domain-containing protein n=1 Tax=Cellulomonas soli TaxID=931535 RepID=UPI003F87DD3A
MGDVLLAVVGDAAASVALLLGAHTLTTTLVLLGAATLAAAAAALLVRGTTSLATLDVTALPAGHVRDALDVRPFVAQSDPDAPGRARPRAPGCCLG